MKRSSAATKSTERHKKMFYPSLLIKPACTPLSSIVKSKTHLTFYERLSPIIYYAPWTSFSFGMELVLWCRFMNHFPNGSTSFFLPAFFTFFFALLPSSASSFISFYAFFCLVQSFFFPSLLSFTLSFYPQSFTLASLSLFACLPFPFLFFLPPLSSFSPLLCRTFLDASSHLYQRVCPSDGPLVGRSLCRRVTLFKK